MYRTQSPNPLVKVTTQYVCRHGRPHYTEVETPVEGRCILVDLPSPLRDGGLHICSGRFPGTVSANVEPNWNDAETKEVDIFTPVIYLGGFRKPPNFP